VLNFIFRIFAGKGNTKSKNSEETTIFTLLKKVESLIYEK